MIVTFLKYVHLYFSDGTKAPSESVSDACWLKSTNYCRVIAIVFFFLPSSPSYCVRMAHVFYFVFCFLLLHKKISLQSETLLMFKN